MKTLKEYAEDINKCSKCGLCQSACPVYKETGNDCAVSRGKFVMLAGVLKGDLQLNKTINKYLNLCLKCGKCSEFCPAGIDVCKIFEAAKYEYMKSSRIGRIYWRAIKTLLNAVDFMGNLSKKRIRRGKLLNQTDALKQLKMCYFKGCVNKVYPKVENALKKVLSHYNVELVEKDFVCCGKPYLSGGDLESFESAKKHNLELLKDDDFDYILTDCASCEDTLRGYGLENVINIADFIAHTPRKFIFKKHKKITFHKPCHLKKDDFLSAILKKCVNVEYLEMNNYDECCGFAGEFAINNMRLSRQISAKKAENILNTKADYVLTMCPACVMGLHQGFMAKGKIHHPRIMNIIEFLALADEIK